MVRETTGRRESEMTQVATERQRHQQLRIEGAPTRAPRTTRLVLVGAIVFGAVVGWFGFEAVDQPSRAEIARARAAQTVTAYERQWREELEANRQARAEAVVDYYEQHWRERLEAIQRARVEGMVEHFEQRWREELDRIQRARARGMVDHHHQLWEQQQDGSDG